MIRRYSSSGNIMIMLLGGIALAGTLSFVLSQLMSGPMLTISKISKRVTSQAEMESAARMVVITTGTLASNGDCDSDGSIEPPEWRATAGAKPTGAGLLPLTTGGSVTDPWGTDYGYCVWDVGSTIRGAGCGGVAEKRLQGSPTPTDGRATTQTLFAIVSAGPDRQFQTTCAAYTDATTDEITTSGDDRVLRYTYSDMTTAASSLWQIKIGTPSTATINKDLEIGDSSAIGTISSLSLTTVGKINAGGGAKPADETVVINCDGSSEGLLRYNDTTDRVQYCDGTGWVDAGMDAEIADINGMSDGVANYTSLYSVFLGQHSGDGLSAGVDNTGVGYNALAATDSDGNTAMGYGALEQNDSGIGNTAFGASALNSNTTGLRNVAAGYMSLYKNTTGIDNVAVGATALYNNISGENNIAIGPRALSLDSVPYNNVAVGMDAMLNASSVSDNIAIGTSALANISGVSDNIAIGYSALVNANSKSNNIGIGWNAMIGEAGDIGGDDIGIGAYALATVAAGGGDRNTAMGSYALRSVQRGADNTAFGYQALFGMSGDYYYYNTAFGYQSLYNNNVHGNTAMGYQALYSNVSGDRNTAVGMAAMAGLDSGYNNTAVGYAAMYNAGAAPVGGGHDNTAVGLMSMGYLNDGRYNTAVGALSLLFASGGTGGNTAVGSEAFYRCQNSDCGVAVGYGALRENIMGQYNTAIGYKAGYNNDSDGTGNAAYNVMVGYEAMKSNVTGGYSTAIGYQALSQGDGYRYNTAVGYQALMASSGNNNTAVGYQALLENASGNDNTAIGNYALIHNLGSDNTAIGFYALYTSTSGSYNTAVGVESLREVTTSSYNTALGDNTLRATDTSEYNTAIGYLALNGNGTYSYTTAVGANALASLIANDGNTAVGFYALSTTTDGIGNTAFGGYALGTGDAADYNTAVGLQAGYKVADNANTVFGSGTLPNAAGVRYATVIGAAAASSLTGSSGNTVIGYGSMTTPTIGGSNTVIGAASDITGDYTNSTVMGWGASVSASHYVRFGDTAQTTIAGQVAWTVTSDRRSKKDIQDTDLGLDFIQKLKPVTYRLKKGNGRLDYGFIAQDVEAALGGRVTNMVTRENDSMKTYKLRASDIIAPSVRAVQTLSNTNDAEDRVLSKTLTTTKIILMLAGLLGSFGFGLYGGRLLRRNVFSGGVS